MIKLGDMYRTYYDGTNWQFSPIRRRLEAAVNEPPRPKGTHDGEPTFILAKPAPSRIKAAGMEIPPMKSAVSRMKERGGLASGALGIFVPVQPSTWMKRALSGRTREQGRAMQIAMVTGMRKFLRIPFTL